LHFFQFKKALGICGDVSATFSTSQHVLQIATIAPAVHTLADTTATRAFSAGQTALRRLLSVSAKPPRLP
ncbi:hypothetical protein, partial [Rhizobium leguminosarum]|uniref:hypothetical protein n=1 Tax=Rhizobium leguminosarum TaxID=384 RepID=UPI001C912FFE